jgi:hypothetical protein
MYVTCGSDESSNMVATTIRIQEMCLQFAGCGARTLFIEIDTSFLKLPNK